MFVAIFLAAVTLELAVFSSGSTPDCSTSNDACDIGIEEVSALQVMLAVNSTAFASQSHTHASGDRAETAPLCSNGRVCPHIIMVLADDLGWWNVPWNNPDLEPYMPTSSGLAKEGVVLDRHYGFWACAPSRASLLTGRLPFHATSQDTDEMANPAFGPSTDMTFFSAKFKELGYATHATGKWHLGVSKMELLPQARGFDTWFGYFAGEEDHWTQDFDSQFKDLWIQNSSFNGPAREYVGTYGDETFSNYVVQTLEDHPASQPVFFYVGFQNPHEPLQAPIDQIQVFPETWTEDRKRYAGMVRYLDVAMLNITNVLKNRGMWQHTLLIFSSDNGAPETGNNYPLFGQKTSPFEGGIRLASFISGGFLPASVRGTRQEGFMHLADWYATLCDIIGADTLDAGFVPLDSLSMWPLITGQSATSPRNEIPIAVGNAQASLIEGRYKVITGRFTHTLPWAPDCPTVDQDCPESVSMDCSEGCLYDILGDPSEHKDISAQMPQVREQLLLRLAELAPETVVKPTSTDPLAEKVWTRLYGNFLGPWLL